MKNSIFPIVLICLLSWSGHAQDTIVLKDGTKIKTKVLEVDGSDVKYKRFDNIDGPTYTAKKETIVKIKYQNGVEDVFAGSNRKLEQMKRKPHAKVQYAGLIELGGSFGVEINESVMALGSSIATAHGVKIDDKYMVGLGVGVNMETLDENKYRYVSMPIFATTQIDLTNDKNKIFVSAQVGGQVGIHSEINRTDSKTHNTGKPSGGIWANGMIGMRCGKFYVAAGPTVRSAHDTLKPGKYVAVGGMLALGIRL